MGMIKEFKEFAMKGNLVDLAVGFVMGAAFTRLTTAFIDGMIMPLIGLIQGKDLSEWRYVLKPAEMAPDGKEIAAEVSIKYGTFISVVLEFIIVAFVMFLVVKAINRLKRKQEVAPAAAPEPSMTDKLLMEIRDSLRK
jgi:large conductance mechanosensitive channel